MIQLPSSMTSQPTGGPGIAGDKPLESLTEVGLSAEFAAALADVLQIENGEVQLVSGEPQLPGGNSLPGESAPLELVGNLLPDGAPAAAGDDPEITRDDPEISRDQRIALIDGRLQTVVPSETPLTPTSAAQPSTPQTETSANTATNTPPLAASIARLQSLLSQTGTNDVGQPAAARQANGIEPRRAGLERALEALMGRAAQPADPSVQIAPTQDAELPSLQSSATLERLAEAIGRPAGEVRERFAVVQEIMRDPAPASRALDQLGITTLATNDTANASTQRLSTSGFESALRDSSQLETLIENLAQARETGRAAKGEMLVRHEEFGVVSMKLAAMEGELKATLNSRDPGFALAAQNAIAERSVAAVTDSSSAQSRAQDNAAGQGSSGGQQQRDSSAQLQQGGSSGDQSSAQSERDSMSGQASRGSDEQRAEMPPSAPTSSGLYA
ncbi:hypothetical protein ACRAQ6_00225 [Erythrobacter sp. HA6-11]